MHTLLKTISTLALTCLIAACSSNSSQQAKQLVNNFYQANQTAHPRGALTLQELLTFRQFVSVPLFELLKNVSEAEEAHLREVGDHQPPLVEGNLFTSLPQGATTYRLINCQLESGEGSCRVELIYTDAQHKSPTKWVDKVILTKDVRGWVIGNISYGGEAAPLRSGDLHSALLDILSSDKPESPDDMDEED